MSDFKISDMDDWMNSDDEESSEEEGEGEDEEAKEKKAKKKKRMYNSIKNQLNNRNFLLLVLRKFIS